MELSITGNPGSGNSYDDVDIKHVANYNPNARKVVSYNNYEGSTTRLSRWFMQLKEEFLKDVRLQKKLDDIKRYRTKLPRTLGLEKKLQDGGFSKTAIDNARRKKQYYAKKATRFQYYESAQRIDSYLFAIVCNRFESYVFPLIQEAKPLALINRAVYEQVILPVMQQLNADGSEDTCLCYNEDDIFGMLYYLTGNCHINWCDYDV